MGPQCVFSDFLQGFHNLGNCIQDFFLAYTSCHLFSLRLQYLEGSRYKKGEKSFGPKVAFTKNPNNTMRQTCGMNFQMNQIMKYEDLMILSIYTHLLMLPLKTVPSFNPIYTPLPHTLLQPYVGHKTHQRKNSFVILQPYNFFCSVG